MSQDKKRQMNNRYCVHSDGKFDVDAIVPRSYRVAFYKPMHQTHQPKNPESAEPISSKDGGRAHLPAIIPGVAQPGRREATDSAGTHRRRKAEAPKVATYDRTKAAKDGQTGGRGGGGLDQHF